MALRNYFLSSILFIILYACSQDTCTQFLDNTAQMKFSSSATKEDTTINNIWVSILNEDASFLLEDKDTTGIKLPLNQSSDISEFIFTIHYIEIDGNDTNEYDVVDTISLVYQSEPQYISSGCGFRMSYKLEEILNTQNNFDSIKIIEEDSLINIDNENQFKIYF